MALPIKNGKIGTPYGVKGDRWSAGHHQGVDFPCKVGTKILAVADGKVVGIASWGPAFGAHSVVVKHGKWYAMYAHCSKNLVKVGDKVKIGQVIALSGAEGNVTGPHLHFEVRSKNRWGITGDVDPKYLLSYTGKKPLLHRILGR